MRNRKIAITASPASLGVCSAVVLRKALSECWRHRLDALTGGGQMGACTANMG